MIAVSTFLAIILSLSIAACESSEYVQVNAPQPRKTSERMINGCSFLAGSRNAIDIPHTHPSRSAIARPSVPKRAEMVTFDEAVTATSTRATASESLRPGPP